MWVLVNANGYAFDASQSRFSGLAIDGEEIVAVGTSKEIEAQFASRATRILDVQGATVIPGLVDNHLHLAGVGEMSTRLDLNGAKSKDELLATVRAWSAKLPQHAWVLGTGWDENHFAAPDLPTLAEIDAAVDGRPALLTRICRHAYMASSAALLAAGVTDDTPDPNDGKYGRDATGQLNGLVCENASKPLLRVIPPMTKDAWTSALATAMRQALAHGITAVHTDDVRYIKSVVDTREIYRTLVFDERIRLRIHGLIDWDYIHGDMSEFEIPLSEQDWVAFGAAKLFADGAMGGRTAWLSAPYADMPDSNGQPMYAQSELNERVRVAHERGFPVAIHAIGDAGLDAALTALEQVEDVPVGGRDRIVHAELVDDQLLARMAALKDRLAVDVQPRFTVSDFPWLLDRLGDARAPYACAWQRMAEVGLHIGGGSDAPIEPLDPLLGIHAAITRRLPNQTEGYYMEQALTPLDAVKLFGQDASFANGMEHRKGVIAAGWLADLTVLSKDVVYPTNPDEILDAQVLYTIVGGHIAYENDCLDEEGQQ